MRKNTVAVLVLVLLVLLSMGLSMAIGSNLIPFRTVWQSLWHPDGSFESVVVTQQRWPRTLLLIAVGAALGTAGALMQALTRNPLADPGILGVNAGASLAVVAAVAVFGISTISFYVWFSFIGAALAAVAVYIIGSTTTASIGTAGGPPNPSRLALAGVAVSMAIQAIVQVIILTNQQAFNEFRFWAAGSAQGRGFSVFLTVIGFILLGLVLAFLITPALNAMALGDAASTALGVRLGLVRAVVMCSVTLLAGAATAAIGPIMFVGLAVPYVARTIAGADWRWIVALSALGAPSFLLLADVLARVVVMPNEIEVGLMSAIIGGPIFVALVRRSKVSAI
ncbi:FecCD family ABC transporter permease [Corynebacterium pelargi]|uniref:Putative siderophore transport system permease protein YfiZ n=1 Tax=Corynebacterium pelargi TaxID=1471400 RepID=A0A410WB11_9CORY|nr:iron chelate uptake ABC transporter family permease subunit [Corynebacterium pelargi]QAU53142.1 putative siderophore transport system permease protein YfiZ precursor [Corynebacterium pelargi]